MDSSKSFAPWTKSFAPWTEEEVTSLNDYQRCGLFHEFTGDNGETLLATSVGWITNEGGPIVQNWAHSFMVDGTWRGMLEQLRLKGYK